MVIANAKGAFRHDPVAVAPGKAASLPVQIAAVPMAPVPVLPWMFPDGLE